MTSLHKRLQNDIRAYLTECRIVLITENQDRCFGSNSEIVLYEIPSPISYHLNSKPEVSNKYQVACRNLQPIFIHNHFSGNMLL